MRRCLAGFVLCAALFGFSGASLSAAATRQATQKVYVVNCAHRVVSKPATIVTTCADGYTYFSGLKWSGWGTKKAKATGTFHMNPCTPTCVASKPVAYKTTVTLTVVKKVKSHALYTQLKASYVKGTRTLSYSFGMLTS